MKRLLATILTVTLMTPALAFADGHLDSEKSVKEAIQQYWDARNNRDHETVAAMESDSGMYGTNSDGSFHSQWQRQLLMTGSAIWLVMPPTCVLHILKRLKLLME